MLVFPDRGAVYETQAITEEHIIRISGEAEAGLSIVIYVASTTAQNSRSNVHKVYDLLKAEEH